MKTSFLDFEQPVADLEGKIEALRFAQDDSAVDISEEIGRLEKKGQTLTKDIYAKQAELHDRKAHRLLERE